MRTALHIYKELDLGCIRQFLPKRAPRSYKGDYGKVLLICGSVGYTGAAKLAAQAAARSGAGIVYLAVPESIYPITAQALSEPVVVPLHASEGHVSAACIPELKDLIEKADAILYGPGIGVSEDSVRVLEFLLSISKVPLLLDADGINCLRERESLLGNTACPVILTPHDGEFFRVYHDAPKGRYTEAKEFAKTYGCILLRKGWHTLITDGETVYRNRTGNPGMAKGGSGDVLSGIITAFLGKGIPPLEAAALGAYVHGAAGDLCSRELGEEGMLPSDMVAAIPRVLKPEI